MSDVRYFNLPDVGEGLTEAEIVTWKVKAGDTVKVNDVIVEIETAKSLVELPCPFAGTIVELLAAEGDTVNVGMPIIGVETGEPSAAADVAPAAPVEQPVPEAPAVGSASEDLIPTPKSDEPVEPGLIGGPAPGGRTSVLVGYGPRTTEAKRRPRKGATPVGASPAAAQVGVQHSFTPHATPPPEVAIEDAPSATPTSASVVARSERSNVAVLAKPPVRKLAKDLGVDLAEVTPTGEGGTITRTDVEQLASSGVPAAAQPVPQPSWTTGERETRLPIKSVRKVTAQAMVASAFTAPHVTEWVTLDATRTMKMVERLRARREFRDIKVSPLLVVARAVCLAARRTPEVNSVWDDPAQEIVVKHYVNLGIAAATPRGLLVPNIKDADSLAAVDLARAINDLAATARDGKTPPADQAGGTFTITNVGVFGVDSGTPIINPGESAILAMGAIKRQPWVVGNRVKPRWVTTLALSFDHRVIDGEQGSRFLADVAAIVEDPGAALLF
ncbi:MAG TPA: dihydrolipoamide acetyltransferase family protein [Nocardioidaceae bacterium]|nr:dihydrolipoamide acetyltransferase family protein [Nocardioidaceae bacterium]